MSFPATDITNQKFGNLTAISRAGTITPRKHAAWRCRCTCGKEVIVSGPRLRQGHNKSCGIAGHKFRVKEKAKC